MSHKLFKNKELAKFNAYILSVIPGSVWGTIRVWNPLIAIPLMSGVFLSILKARKSRFYLGLTFLLLGLTLQAEFAYAIFYSLTLFILIPWIRKEFNVKDFLIAAISFGSTLIPQIVFELRHNFVMTNSLPRGMKGYNQEIISWGYHFSKRPSELFTATKDLLFRGGLESGWILLILMFFVAIGFYVVANKNQLTKEKKSLFAWKLISIFAILPYPFYMIWKGNNGYFFDYYITSHFIFLVPLLLMGITKIYKINKQGKYFAILMIGFFITYWYQSLYATSIKPVNNAGLKTMDNAISKIYSWINEDNQNPGVVRIFTPNAETEHYDAILHWKAGQLNKDIPITIKNDQDEYWYILIEPDKQLEKRLNKWYAEATESGVLTRVEMVGDLRIESWVNEDVLKE